VSAPQLRLIENPDRLVLRRVDGYPYAEATCAPDTFTRASARAGVEIAARVEPGTVRDPERVWVHVTLQLYDAAGDQIDALRAVADTADPYMRTLVAEIAELSFLPVRFIDERTGAEIGRVGYTVSESFRRAAADANNLVAHAYGRRWRWRRRNRRGADLA
jgi:hypothetical protein